MRVHASSLFAFLFFFFASPRVFFMTNEAAVYAGHISAESCEEGDK